MNLSPHFTLAELTRSSTAERLRLDNTPTPPVLQELQRTAAMLEAVTSSDHARGCAADIVAPLYGTPYDVAKALAPMVSVLGIGQLILEGVKGKQWVHLSTQTPAKLANRVITITDAGAQLGIQELA
jgi:zinc D-Ala-D-Ala carboxypeptidase